MSSKIQIGITLTALILTVVVSSSIMTAKIFGQNLIQANQTGNQTGNQTANQSSPYVPPIPGSTSQGSSGSSGLPY